MRNMHCALPAFSFAVNIRDLKGAGRIVKSMSRRLSRTADQKKMVQGCASMLEGVVLYQNRDYTKAALQLLDAKKRGVMYSDDLLFMALLHAACEDWEKKDDRSALQAALLALSLKPGDVLALYDTGAMQWHAVQTGSAAEDSTLQDQLLATFLKKTEDQAQALAQARDMAGQMLQDKFQGRPPLLIPPDPAPLFQNSRG